MARRTKRLFTIGYEQTPSRAVLDELEAAGVKLLVDVRAVASSRRPGFSKNQLAAGLDERGISYLHLKGLGTPKSGREAARSGKLGLLHKIYSAHLKTAQAKEQLDELSALVNKSGPVCILCYERDHAVPPAVVAEIIGDRDGVKVESRGAAGPLCLCRASENVLHHLHGIAYEACATRCETPLDDASAAGSAVCRRPGRSQFYSPSG